MQQSVEAWESASDDEKISNGDGGSSGDGGQMGSPRLRLPAARPAAAMSNEDVEAQPGKDTEVAATAAKAQRVAATMMPEIASSGRAGAVEMIGSELAGTRISASEAVEIAAMI